MDWEVADAPISDLRFRQNDPFNRRERSGHGRASTRGQHGLSGSREMRTLQRSRLLSCRRARLARCFPLKSASNMLS
jgi:hypothetical protein